MNTTNIQTEIYEIAVFLRQQPRETQNAVRSLHKHNERQAIQLMREVMEN